MKKQITLKAYCIVISLFITSIFANSTGDSNYIGLAKVTSFFFEMKGKDQLISIKSKDKGGNISIYYVSSDMLREPFLSSDMITAIKGHDNAYLADISFNNMKFKVILFLSGANVSINSEYKYLNKKWTIISDRNENARDGSTVEVKETKPKSE